MLVLDLVEGQGADGTVRRQFVVRRASPKSWFCPVVVYSAFPKQQSFNHPLVTTVKKGADTEFRGARSPEGLR